MCSVHASGTSSDCSGSVESDRRPIPNADVHATSWIAKRCLNVEGKSSLHDRYAHYVVEHSQIDLICILAPTIENVPQTDIRARTHCEA